MFTIYGGKTAFDQWEQEQRVICQGMSAGDKVTFTNCTGETHPMMAYSYEGIVVCDVPNDLLMKAMPILVDLCGNHEHRTRLLVNAKEKPDGYVYVDNTAYPQESTGGSGGGTVKSVNGVEPDESGDVTIETGGGSPLLIAAYSLSSSIIMKTNSGTPITESVFKEAADSGRAFVTTGNIRGMVVGYLINSSTKQMVYINGGGYDVDGMIKFTPVCFAEE